jgi:hypothetical protein
MEKLLDSEWVQTSHLSIYTGLFISPSGISEPLRYSSRDGHAEGEHVNKGRDTPSFCPTLQVLDMCTLGDAADVNPVIKFLECLSLC